MYKVYLVEGKRNPPGRIYAVFHSAEDAKLHQASVEDETVVIERTVFTGQANNPGYNR